MNEWDFEELLCAMFLITDEMRSTSDYDVDEICEDKLGISFEDFVRVGNALLSLTPPAKSPLTSKFYHAFMVDGIAYVKREADV